MLCPAIALLLRIAPARVVRPPVRQRLKPDATRTGGNAPIARRRAPGRAARPLTADAIARIVAGAAARMPFGRNCLVRAIVARRLVTAYGFDAQLIIGVAPQGRGIAAHAWIECEGRPILPPGALPYLPLPLAL